MSQSFRERSRDNTKTIAERHMPVPQPVNRIFFLDYLRAVAVLLVVWAHIFLVGIADFATVRHWIPSFDQPTFGAESAVNVYAWLHIVGVDRLRVTSGGLGVAVFFLISGFVILKTIDTAAPLDFLLRRFFRIVPLCAAVVAATALITYVYCQWQGLEQPHSILGVASSALALNYYSQTFPTLPVLWTLEVEWAFYLLMACAAGMAGRLQVKALVLIALLCMLYVAATRMTPLSTVLSPLAVDRVVHVGSLLVHINLMLLGSALYRLYASPFRLGVAMAALVIFILYLLSFRLFNDLGSGRNIGTNAHESTLALGLFILALWTNPRVPRFPALRWIGKISYPLYLVHVPLGWAVLALLAAAGWNMHAAALGSTAAVVLVAWWLHLTLELRAQKWGKQATNFLHARRMSITASLDVPLRNSGIRRRPPWLGAPARTAPARLES